MRIALTVIGIAMLAGTFARTAAFCAEELTIDDFSYPTADAARAVWTPIEGSDPAEVMLRDGKPVMRIPCNYKREDLRRAGYDRKVQLDLSAFGSISFDFYCDDPAPIGYTSIYFHAVDGWYTQSFPFAKGWTHVVLSKGGFGIEDKPAGWQKVDTIRISTWRGRSANTFCAIANLRARSEDVAIVYGSETGPEAETVRRCAQTVGGYLTSLGVPYGALSDDDVAAGSLRGKKIAIVSYDPVMSDTAADEMEKFVAAGGKVIVFYSIHPKIAKLLSVPTLNYLRSTYDGQLGDIVFNGPDIEGLPAKIRENSWNANIPDVGAGNARAIGVWQDKAGKSAGAAVVLSDNGAYIGHILTDGDEDAKREFVLALVGHFVPSAWENAATAALDRAKRVGPFSDRDAFIAWMDTRPGKAAFQEAVNQRFVVADAAVAKATVALAAKRYREVLTDAADAGAAQSDAYLLAHTPRDGEFRAVWNHSGTGDCGTWDEAMKRLAAANFNAVVPNMLWGGLAYYKSKLLPVAPWVAEKGDQIALAVAAGKKYGIKVYPWKVNWNLANAPKDFVDKMRAEGRLLKSHKGEDRLWLCPSNPANFQLELDTMLEVARNYDVDGVHFDYIRYPDDDGCFCDGCRERFEKWLGRKVENWPADCWNGPLKKEWSDWRCTNITHLVRSTAEEIRKFKPQLRISAAVFSDYPACRTDVGQDWVLWVKNGWLDFVCPMDYTDSDVRFQTLVSNQVGYVGGKCPIYSGIGQFIIPDDQVVGQMEISRACGADGFIVFNMGTTLAEEGLPRYSIAMTSAKALLPHDAPVIEFHTSQDASIEPVVPVTTDALSVSVDLVSFGARKTSATAVAGQVELQDLDGRSLGRLASLPAQPGKVTVTVPKREGVFRLAAVGTMTLADGTKQRFIRRSRPYQF